MTSPSKKQVDRLGERLRKGEASGDDFRELEAYRRSFDEASKEVFSIVKLSTGMNPIPRPGKN